MSVVIVIPVFDEAATIAHVVRGARAYGPVLVIDDGSRDDSATRAAAAGAEVLRHPRRLGKGQALLSGVAAARRRGATLVVTLDGDGQHDPDAIPALLAAARDAGRVVVGNRLDGRGRLPVTRRNAICVASFFASWVSGVSVADSQSGFRVYPLALFDEVPTRRGGFVFETELLLAAAARGWAIEQVSVPALPRMTERSRFRPIRDGVAIGAFLAGRALVRWGWEARTVTGELLAVFHPDRMAARHAAILAATADYSDSPARWGLAVGAAAARRAGARLTAICDDAGRRGTGRAALATLAIPLTLPLLLLSAVAGERVPDLVTSLVDALYGGRRRGAFEVDAVGVGADPMTESGR